MDANELIHKDEVFQIIGVAFSVINELGHGLHEKPYENAMVVEFEIRKIAFQQQARFPVIYKGVQVAEYVPDLIAYGLIIIDAKVIDRITDGERGQMMNYLRIARLQVGLIINFKHAKLEWERIVLSDHSR